MATRTKPRFENLEEILQAFDNIPAWRIRSDPSPGTATEKDWERLHEKKDRLYELVDGTLVEKTMGAGEAYLAAELIFLIRTFLQTHRLGAVFAPDAASKLMPGLIRLPHVSFVRWDRFPVPGKVPRVAALDLAPDLAVEILSPGNTRSEMERKRREYFLAGVIRVWIVDPETRTVEVYSDPETCTRFQEADTLIDEAVLPDFALPLVQLFADMAEPAQKPKARRRKK